MAANDSRRSTHSEPADDWRRVGISCVRPGLVVQRSRVTEPSSGPQTGHRRRQTDQSSPGSSGQSVGVGGWPELKDVEESESTVAACIKL